MNCMYVYSEIKGLSYIEALDNVIATEESLEPREERLKKLLLLRKIPVFELSCRTDQVTGWKKHHDHRFGLVSNYRLALLTEIVLWYSASLPAVAVVPNATGTETYCQKDLVRSTKVQPFCIFS